MKIKLSRQTVLGHDAFGKVGETVEVSDKLGRELVRLGRGEEVTGPEPKAEAPAKEPEPAKEETADPDPEKRGPGRPRKP